MKIIPLSCLVLATVLLSGVQASVQTGDPAPAFTLTDSTGTARSLSEFSGKIVVLEWTNAECPFVRKQYEPGAMQALQKEITAKGVIWLSIVSSAPGKQGYLDVASAAKLVKDKGFHSTALLLDPEGKVGRAYGAKTTPHLFIMGTDGKLAYHGAIDSIRSPDSADIPKATNYVRQAVTELLAGKAVSVSSTAPYGCGVKY